MEPSNLRSRRLSEALERWFLREPRDLPWRRTYDPYQVWLSEVMLQQTRMEVVVPYFERFLQLFPTLQSLANAPEEEVLAAWSGLGYYRRARMLHSGAKRVVEQGGILPRDAEALRTIPGIGRYTAGAIASIAFEMKEPIVDGNVARVAARIEAFEEPLGSAALLSREWMWARGLVEACHSPRALNQGLMELGALVCRPLAPACALCPVSDLCEARSRGEVAAYPRKRERRQSVELEIPLYIVEDGEGRVLLEMQTTGRLMRGMWHLPHGTSALLDGSEPARFRRRSRIGSFRHTITHRRIRFDLWRADLVGLRDGAESIWTAPDELVSRPHPSYVAKAFRLWRSARG